jgi:hypothetical protein
MKNIFTFNELFKGSHMLQESSFTSSVSVLIPELSLEDHEISLIESIPIELQELVWQSIIDPMEHQVINLSRLERELDPSIMSKIIELILNISWVRIPSSFHGEEYSKYPEEYEKYFEASMGYWGKSLDVKKDYIEKATKKLEKGIEIVRDHLTPVFAQDFIELIEIIDWEVIPLLHLTAAAYSDMCTIKFDPIFTTYLDLRAVAYVVLHEIFHILVDDFTGGSGLDHQTYNKAADYINNLAIIEVVDKSLKTKSGKSFAEPRGPMKGLLDEKWKSYNTKQVYDELIKDKQCKDGSCKNPDKNPAEIEIGDTVINKKTGKVEGTVISIYKDPSGKKIADIK